MSERGTLTWFGGKQFRQADVHFLFHYVPEDKNEQSCNRAPALAAASLLRDLCSAWLGLKWTGSFIVLSWQGVEEQIDKDAWVSGKLGDSWFIEHTEFHYSAPSSDSHLPTPSLDPSLPLLAK